MRDTIAPDGAAPPARPSGMPGGMTLRPLTAAIGVELGGVDLRAPLTDATIAAIREVLLEHLVVFFRDQHLDDDQHLAFAQRFGPLSISPVATKYQDSPTVTVLDQVSPKGEGA